ncbi:hypothetical protein QBC36DRAFT_212056 [Triangularia setosa]|uniref:Uncharacterized protein n=1 Tax=Triangularia setosa TaxID=2587417 RepID=A0AAN6W8L8_9PEZI|nr:hypothetical protein QBC36DRAFT_212056 [Podospora setosa]
MNDNPIGNGLDASRTTYRGTGAGASCNPDALGQLDFAGVQNLTIDLHSALQSFRVPHLFCSSGSGKDLFGDLLRLTSAVHFNDFGLSRIKPLLNAAYADYLDDALVWERVYDAVTDFIPPPRPIASSLQQAPWLPNTDNFANLSEHRKYVDNVLKEDIGSIYVDIQGF